MIIPRYWAKGEEEGFVCWRWSDHSEADARTKAREWCHRIAQLVRSGTPKSAEYGYSTGALREQVVKEISRNGDKLTAVITRNRYGAEVLCAENIMFVDIDLAEEKKSSGGFLSGLFGKKPPAIDLAAEALEKIESWFQRNPRWGARVYRTKGGFRLLVTHETIDATDSQVTTVLNELGADPLYVTLCRNQQCFRARLTPKPWRMDYSCPSVAWPFENTASEQNFGSWLAEYNSRGAGFATATFVKGVGNKRVASEIAPIVTLHDDATKAKSALDLA